MDNSNQDLPVRAITLQEAKDKLPFIRDTLDTIHELYDQYVTQMELLKLESSTAEPQEISRIRFHLDLVEERLVTERELLRQNDVLLKDYRLGLIDMVAIRESKPVFICFKRGETDLLYYHEIETGYKGRKLIDFN